MKPKRIRLSAAAKRLGCSRNTMHEIADKEGMRKHRLKDGKTSPWYLPLAEVERYEKMRMEL